MILNKGAWTAMSEAAQTSYVIAVIDSQVFVLGEDKAEESHRQKIPDRIEGMNSDDFISIIDMRYRELESYRSSPWFQLDKGLEQVCGVK